MPRTQRATVAGHCYHALNRGNCKSRIFHEAADYDAFEALAVRAKSRTTLRILAWCLMPNHFHFVVRPAADNDLSRFLHWLMTTHVRRHHLRRGTDGRVWQGRFKVFPVKTDGHLLRVLRYVERNPLRAGLVEAAEDWPWSSLSTRLGQTRKPMLDDGPLAKPDDWLAMVNEPLTRDELEAIRLCGRRGRPYGDEAWTIRTALDLGLESSIRKPHESRRSVRVLDIRR